jgi:hypothetical protein
VKAEGVIDFHRASDKPIASLEPRENVSLPESVATASYSRRTSGTFVRLFVVTGRAFAKLNRVDHYPTSAAQETEGLLLNAQTDVTSIRFFSSGLQPIRCSGCPTEVQWSRALSRT